MRGIWTISRHTLAHCLRMKVAGTFILMLLAALAILPVAMKGDGTLAGRIRTLLAYGTGITGLLLSIVTLLMSAGAITSDVHTRQIFTVATKPVSRWQYVVGRWLGVVIFDIALLAVSGAAIYAFSQHLRRQEALNPQDRRAVETEVFAARRKVGPEPTDVKALARQRRNRLEQEGRYQEALQAFLTKTRGDQEKAKVQLDEQILSDAATAAQSAGPMGVFYWRFSGISVAGAEMCEIGQVIPADEETGALRIAASDGLLGRLVFGGPVRINNVDLHVTRLEKDFFEVSPTIDDRAGGRLATAVPGAFADIVADSTIQITFKASPAVDPNDGLLDSHWELGNPTTGLWYVERRTDPVRTPATLTVSARLVDPNGQMEARYVNLPDSRGASTSVTILDSDISVLYRVGAFEGNFIRGMLLILLQLVFLAAVGVFAGSFLSFPVACLIGLSTLPLSMARGFLSQSLKIGSASVSSLDALTLVGATAFRVTRVLLPDFAQTSPGESLVGGLSISWEYLGHVALLTLAARAAPVLALACLIFHKRELARVQV
jgi:hypothetical protein